MENENVNINVNMEQARTEIENGDPLTIEQETKILLALSKIFETTDAQPTQDIINGFDSIILVDSAHVCMLKAKNKIANRLLTRFYQTSRPTAPVLNYGESGTLRGSFMSFEYLKKIVKVFEGFESKKSSVYGGAIHFLVASDYPLTIENEYFSFLVAPRIEE